MTNLKSQAESNEVFVQALVESGLLCDRFSEIEDVDVDGTSADLTSIAFADGSRLFVDAQWGSVTHD